MPRSSIAAATGPPFAAGSSISTQISSGAVAVGQQVLDVARHRLGLRALVGAAPEAQLRLCGTAAQAPRSAAPSG